MARIGRLRKFILRAVASALLVGVALPQGLSRDDACNLVWDEVYSLARRRGLQDPEDLAQTVVYKMLKSRAGPLSFGEARLRGYARRAARHAISDTFKDPSRSYAPLSGLEQTRDDETGEEVDGYRDWLSALTADQRRVWRLRTEERLSTKAVARRLRISRQKAKRLLGRATRSFRKQYAAASAAMLAALGIGIGVNRARKRRAAAESARKAGSQVVPKTASVYSSQRESADVISTTIKGILSGG